MSAGTFYDATGGASLVTDGPIIGTDEPAIRLPALDYLTTGDMSSGDAGDAGGLTGFTIELWFRTPTVGASQTIAQGPTAHAALPNRQWTLLLTAAGKIQFSFVNTSNTTLTATGNTVLQTGQWYHLAGMSDSGTARVYVNGVQDAAVIAGGAPWNDGLVAGSADMRIGGSGNGYILDFANVAFYRYALSATRVNAHYVAGTQRGFPSIQSTGARIGAVLDSVSSSAPRNLDSGGRVHSFDALTSRYMTGQPALDPIRETLVYEALETAFFCGADGSLIFLDSSHRASAPYNTVQATFGDGAGELAYTDITLDYSDSYLTNIVNVTREGSSESPGQVQTASDTASRLRYRDRPTSLDGIPAKDDGTCALIASDMLAKYKQPLQRITSITFSPLDPDVALAVFRREIGDKIRVLRTPPGGGARIQQDVWIQKIEVAGSNDGTPLSVRWAVSPL